MRITHAGAALCVALFLAGCGGSDPAESGSDAVTTTSAGMSSTEPAGSSDRITADLTAEPDPMGGVNVHVETEGFDWAPEKVAAAPAAGEGHAHLYVDGEKVARLYTPWFHLADVEPGDHELEVRLTGHDHGDITSGGGTVTATATVSVPSTSSSMPDGHDGVDAPGPMSVAVTATPDPEDGVNVRIDAEGFTWAPGKLGDGATPGEGHAHIYVDGEKYGRVYGEAVHLSGLEPGSRTIRVTLNDNEHHEYQVDGEVVEGEATVEVPAGG